MRIPRHLWMLLAAVALVAIAARVLPMPRNVDDSFITFRYARNLVEGHGFVYNEGVRTLGTTTPLYTLIMAGMATLLQGDSYPFYALSINALADALNAALLALIAYRITQSPYPAAVMGLLWAVAPRSVTFAIGGMETSVFILWMLAATWAYLDNRRAWVGFFAGLGILTRPDAALWILPLGLWQLIADLRDTDRNGWAKLPLATWGAGLAVLLPWILFAWSYFGSPLPNSLGAKRVAYHVKDFDALVTLLQRYATPFMEFDTFGQTGAITGAVLYVMLNLFALLYVPRRAHRAMPLLLYAWVYIVAFSVANPQMFRWYFVPPMPAWMLGSLIGLWSLVDAIHGRVRSEWLLRGAALAMLLGWGGLLLNAWDWQPDHGPQRPAPAMAWHKLELHYQDVGTQLRDEFGTDPTVRVASADIGAIGYFSRATIIDTVGLVTPELSAYYPFDDAIRVQGNDEQNYAIPPALILDTQPAYFVTMEAFVRLGLEQTPAFTENYTLLREIPTDYYGTGVRLYARNDLLE